MTTPWPHTSREYYFFFQSTGVSHLWHDLCVRNYHAFNSVVFQRDGVERYYILWEDMKRTEVTYLDFYKDLKTLEDNHMRIHALFRELDVLGEEIDESVSLADLFERFVDLSGQLIYAYAMYDQQYTSHLYGDTRPDAAEMQRVVARDKNGFRSLMDPLFFTPDSIMVRLLKKIAHDIDSNEPELQFLSLDELRQAIQGRHVEPRLHKGAEYVVARDGDEVTNLVGAKATAFIDFFLSDEETLRDEIIQGQSVAQKIVVRGRVRKAFVDYARVRESVQAINQIPGGCILVTDSTVPEMVPLMTRSLAIVTDMGGMLSHAAITARELNIPCVVGTSHATRVLKDGDLVEVDAEKGVVRILERKNG